MLKIQIPIGAESYDEATNKFVNSDYFQIELEHSLVSLSKWEAHYEKPFLGQNEKTVEESLFYIEKCMLLTENLPGEIFQKLSQQNYDDIQEYIAAKRSATWFNDRTNRPPSRQIITSAVIYGWMVQLNIPFETQYWHLNELFTLIKVCNEQSKPPKKMGRREAARQQAALNAQRQAQMGTKG